jgi:hypothetical protein
MFYCLHSYTDSCGRQCYTITRFLERDHVIYLVAGKVTNHTTKFYFSHYIELPSMERKLYKIPDMASYCTEITQEQIIHEFYYK